MVLLKSNFIKFSLWWNKCCYILQKKKNIYIYIMDADNRIQDNNNLF